MILRMNKCLFFLKCIAICLILFSCSKENQFTENQKKIIRLYNEIYSSKYKINSNQKRIIDSLESYSKVEDLPFKTVVKVAKIFDYQKEGKELLLMKEIISAEQNLAIYPNDSLFYHVILAKANYFKNSGNYDESLKNYLKAKKSAVSIGDTLKISGVLANIGQLYYQKNDLKTAISYSNQAIAILKNNTSQPPYLIASHTLANIAGMSGKFDEALRIDETCIKICDDLDADVLKVMFLDNKANCYLYSNQLEKAELAFKECLAIDLKVKHKKQIADTYTNLANLHAFKGNEKLMFDYINKSAKIINQINYKPGLLKNYALLQEFYEKNNNFKEASKYSKDYLKVYKELMNEKKETTQAVYQVIHQKEEKEKLILEKQLQYEEAKIWIGIILFALVVIAALFYYKSKKQKADLMFQSKLNEVKLTTKLHEQKIEISRELHDNIGAQLTFINSIIESLRKSDGIKDEKNKMKLAAVSDFTKQTISELRDTIWVLNPNNLNGEELRARMINFIKNAQDSSEQIKFKSNIDINSDLNFNSKFGITIMRVFQEIINNAVKHSNANKVTIDVLTNNQSLSISIIDDGVGFNLDDVDGNGIHNIKNRVSLLDGTVDILSEKNKGTNILISIPL